MMSKKTRNKLIEGPGLLFPLPGSAAGSPFESKDIIRNCVKDKSVLRDEYRFKGS